MCRLQGLSRADKAKLVQLLDEQVEANLGMAMIYTLITAIQEHLQDLVRRLAVHATVLVLAIASSLSL